MHTTYYIIYEFLWSTQVLIARSSMLPLPWSAPPCLGHALRMQHSRTAFMAPQCIRCVCGVCVCVVCVSVSMLYAIVTVTATMRIRHALTFYYAERSRSSNALAPISAYPIQV